MFFAKKNAGLKAADVIAGIIDRFVLTREERLTANQQVQQTILTYAEKTFDGTTTRSRARRVLAFAFCGVYLALIVADAGLMLLGVFYDIALSGADERLLALTKTLSTAVVSIIFFYFGSYGIQSLIAKTREQRQHDRIENRELAAMNREERKERKERNKR